MVALASQLIEEVGHALGTLSDLKHLVLDAATLPGGRPRVERESLGHAFNAFLSPCNIEMCSADVERVHQSRLRREEQADQVVAE